MKLLAVSSWLLVGLATISSCGEAASVLRPPEGPGTSYPCGIGGVECSNGACCPGAHVCGVEGDPWRRCEPGFCCYEGHDDIRTGGARRRQTARLP